MNYKRTILSMLIMTSLAGCNSDDNTIEEEETPVVEEESKTAKYVFLFIGDGMASPQVGATEFALDTSGLSRSDVVIDATDTNYESIGIEQLNMSHFPVIGSATTFAEDRIITGSAAAATALATGYKTTINTISKNGDRTKNLVTIAELAHQKGMAVGIVSSVDIDHATPAGFYAHADSRSQYNYIAAQMADSGFEYFAGGHAKGDEEKYRAEDRNPDGWVAKDIPTVMTAANYTIATDRTALENAITAGGKVWAYTEYSATYDDDGGWGAMHYSIDTSAEDITLAEYTQAGIDLLSTDEDGFFMMVESGKVDWALHANDAVSALQDMVAFDESIGKAIAFYNEHPDDTLIVVTGDHECGGLTLGATESAYASNFELLQYQKVSAEKMGRLLNELLPSSDEEKTALLADETALEAKFIEVLALISENFGLGDESKNEALALSDYERSRLHDAYVTQLGQDIGLSDEEKKLRYWYYNHITVTTTHLLNNKAGLAFTTYSHTALPVPVYALGVGADDFNGGYDNTDVAKKIMVIAALNTSD